MFKMQHFGKIKQIYHSSGERIRISLVRNITTAFGGIFSNIKMKSNIQIIKKHFCEQANEALTNSLTELITDEEAKHLIPRSVRVYGMPHQVFVIQPYIKWGRNKNRISTPQLQLEEAVSLINTLSGWRVVGTRIISSVSFGKSTFFNSGQFQNVKEAMKNETISALFINTRSLKLHQLLLLEKEFQIPVFDRYSIIINIFKSHAHTSEAKLQVALAEIPFISSRIKGAHEGEGIISKNVGIGSEGGFAFKRLQSLKDRKRKLVSAISDLRKKRDLLRRNRTSLQFPVVAIVGYTNAGKTSLIKCLTSDNELKPENKLFATLDVTVHAVELPYNIKALLIDTIGFITDIPTNLIEPFVATLEDAFLADVIVHVQDISHPDLRAQGLHVLETLKNLNLPENLLHNIITVGNKCDKKQLSDIPRDLHLISCLSQFGMEDLKLAISEAIIKAKKMKKIRFRVKNGGSEYRWLIKESAAYNITVDENPQYVFIDVFITEAKFSRFKSEFIN